MDFHDLMSSANRNAKKANREMDRIESEVNDEKNEARRNLENEKRVRMELQRRKAEKAKEMEKRREEERRKSFTIPKKNEPSGSSNSGVVNQDALRAFYQKQEADKKAKNKQAERDKEQLMKLRMQANGGKATKKIGKHFGLDPVELQVRFGGNNEHIETLQKRKCKEEEEAEMESEKYRDGVWRAKQMQKKNEELRSKVTGPHRVATSKSNSLAGLCSRHEKSRDTFSPPKDGKKVRKEERPEKKKMQAAAPVDFKVLMAAASNIAEGKKVDKNMFETRPSKPKEAHRPTNGSSSNGASRSNKDIDREKERRDAALREKERLKEREKRKEQEAKQREKERQIQMKQAASKPTSSSKLKEVDLFDSKSSSSEAKKKVDPKGRFVKGPTPPPMIPGVVPGKKYLPGDVRYKEAMALAKASQGKSSFQAVPGGGVINNGSALANRERVAQVREQERLREKEREKARQMKRQREREFDQEYERPAKQQKKSKEAMRNYEARRLAQLREDQDRDRRKNRNDGFFRGQNDYSDNEEDDYEDDYEDDSDMDDFIDDRDIDMDQMSRKEMEETLRIVNPKYNKEKWHHREKTINERDMHSNFRRITSEESYSKRAGYMEDLREASKGRSERL